MGFEPYGADVKSHGIHMAGRPLCVVARTQLKPESQLAVNSSLCFERTAGSPNQRTTQGPTPALQLLHVLLVVAIAAGGIHMTPVAIAVQFHRPGALRKVETLAWRWRRSPPRLVIIGAHCWYNLHQFLEL